MGHAVSTQMVRGRWMGGGRHAGGVSAVGGGGAAACRRHEVRSPASPAAV